MKHWLLKSNLYYRARSALPYLPIYRSVSVGRSLAGRPAGAGLLATAMRVRLCLRLAAECGRLQAAASSHRQVFYTLKNSFIRSVRPLCRYYTQKIPRTRQYKASHAQCLSARKKANFERGQNLPFCLWRQSHFKTKQISQFLKKTRSAFNLGVNFGSQFCSHFCNQFNVDFRLICFII